MSECCDPNTTSCSSPRKRLCPSNNRACTEVSALTIMQHLKAPWRTKLAPQKYYFCAAPDCDIVYFGEDQSVIKQAALREPVGHKQSGENKLICYCFGVTVADIEHDASIKEFVVQQTKKGLCACEARNPSGRCCLNDFPK